MALFPVPVFAGPEAACRAGSGLRGSASLEDVVREAMSRLAAERRDSPGSLRPEDIWPDRQDVAYALRKVSLPRR